MVITLFTGVLNDDTLSVATDGKVLLEYWTYATEWSNKLHKKYFENIDKAIVWYMTHMQGRVLEQGKYMLESDGVEDYPYTPEEYWNESVKEIAYGN